MAESNAMVARRGYEAALRGDFASLEKFLDAEVKWHAGDPTASGACQNREQALEFIARARTRGVIGELVEVIEAGEKVVVIMRPRGRPADASPLSANVTTFRDGKAVEIVHYPRPEDALAAVGISR
jgi:ketosteroid isomerase-like protein